MKKLFALLFFALPLSLSASKYTPAMYEKATEPVSSENVAEAETPSAPASANVYKDISGSGKHKPVDLFAVLFVLPGLLMTFDRFVIRKKPDTR